MDDTEKMEGKKERREGGSERESVREDGKEGVREGGRNKRKGETES